MGIPLIATNFIYQGQICPSVYATFDRNREHSFDVILEITAAGQIVGLMYSEFPAHI